MSLSPAPGRGEIGHLTVGDAIALEIGKRGERRLDSRLQRRRAFGFGDVDRPQHGLEVARHAGGQRFGAGGEERVRVDAARARDGRGENRIREPDAPEFALHRGGLPPRSGGLGRGFLQEGQPDLEAIVGGETRFDEPGQ